jgi:hypothetical protein
MHGAAAVYPPFARHQGSCSEMCAQGGGGGGVEWCHGLHSYGLMSKLPLTWSPPHTQTHMHMHISLCVIGLITTYLPAGRSPPPLHHLYAPVHPGSLSAYQLASNYSFSHPSLASLTQAVPIKTGQLDARNGRGCTG